MAVVQYSALVTQLRGKLGGSQFNKGHNVQTLQRKSTPTIRQTPAQMQARQRMGIVQRTWKAETPERRAQATAAAQSNPVFDRLGRQVVLAAYNHYVKIMSWRLLVQGSAPVYPMSEPIITTSVSSARLEFTSFDFSLLGVLPDGRVNYSIAATRMTVGVPTGVPAATRVHLYITNLDANGNRYAGSRRRFLRYSGYIDGNLNVPNGLTDWSASVATGDLFLLEVITRNVGAGAQTGYKSMLIQLQ